jgi:predicted flap endonuclease-1-like 5' DNA nuclease
MKELQKLKGIGEVLSRRLLEAGYDSYAKVAAAGEDGLKKIKGLNPAMIRSILTQAEELINETGKTREKKIAELKQRTAVIKEQVQGIALGIRDRFKAEVAGKTGRKLEKEIAKVITSLEKLEGNMEIKMKKAGKGLVKAEKRLENLTGAGLKGVRKGLKKARKSLKRVFT